MVIHPDKLRALLWLRWKMFTRGFTRRGAASGIIGLVSLVIVVLLCGGGSAVGTFLAYQNLALPARTEVLFLVLTAIYVLWICFPLLQINTNEGLDISKLAQFPVTRAELMASLVLSTLLDPITVGLFLVLGAVVLGWSSSLVIAVFAVLAMIIFYIQLIAISQLVIALLQPLLHSRRFRDLSVIVLVLLGSSAYLLQFVLRSFVTTTLVAGISHVSYSPILQWFPPGMAARAVQQASIGNWGMAFLWLGALVGITIVVLYLWQIFISQSMIQAAEGSTQVKQNRRAKHIPQAIPEEYTIEGITSRRQSWLPVQVRAIASKELIYFWRDPQLKAYLIRSLFSIIPLIIVFAYPQINASQAVDSSYAPNNHWLEFFIPNVVLFSLFSLSYNTLGFERQSLTTLFLFPIPPKYILWGKNLVVISLGLLEVGILSVVVAAFTQSWDLLVPTLGIGITGVIIITAIGNFVSIFFPQQLRQVARGFRSNNTNLSAGNGCLQAITGLVALVVTLLVMIPVLLGIILPYITGAVWIWSISVPIALIYGIIIYAVVTNLVAPRMVDKTPEILAVVARE